MDFNPKRLLQSIGISLFSTVLVILVILVWTMSKTKDFDFLELAVLPFIITFELAFEFPIATLILIFLVYCGLSVYRDSNYKISTK